MTTVPVAEMSGYWLQGGRITIGFLGAAQPDKFGNINTTVAGSYAKPKVRLPAAGGGPEIAASCGEIFITLKKSTRGFVDKIDFVASLGHGRDGNDRVPREVRTKGPTKLITDLAVWAPDPDS